MNLDDTNVNELTRSWQTRMESVGRQLVKLAENPVLDKRKDQMVHVAGMFLVPMPDGSVDVRVNVVPTDCVDCMYSTGIEFLEV